MLIFCDLLPKSNRVSLGLIVFYPPVTYFCNADTLKKSVNTHFFNQNMHFTLFF